MRRGRWRRCAAGRPVEPGRQGAGPAAAAGRGGRGAGDLVVCGGLVVPRAGSLHPGRYVQELARVRRRGGAVAAWRGGGAGFERTPAGFRIRTSAGEIAADALMVATKRLYRRGDAVAAPAARAGRELHDRDGAAGRGAVCARCCRSCAFMATRRRCCIISAPRRMARGSCSGGRASFVQMRTCARAGARLHRFLTASAARPGRHPHHPCLEGQRRLRLRLSAACRRQHEGVHYALACNGSGVVTMTHLGRQAALQILGRANTGFPPSPACRSRPCAAMTGTPVVHAAGRRPGIACATG